ncbi:F0F1 ATP synthase subunit gamma [Neolewinella antarctica]|uniref:F-type H+-transporting ATPase subunit gamma n=1 Tax=Neolewinella antarctica TaxID=442734 RepID=A0ABX0XDF1_9BACT|nr:F0F1 ATP synthase subunit gamma [Neolewinella antarctica]NJC26961.1 F-type H+-transporting ATPase subunit gamma [Neolewinella antarctica]
MDTLAHIQHKLVGAEDLKSVVRTMKAMAASKIGQYELAVESLSKYHHTISLGLFVYFRDKPGTQLDFKALPGAGKSPKECAVIFGSDQGLVGPFNDTLATFMSRYLTDLPGEKVVWVVGERMKSHLVDIDYEVTKSFPLPSVVESIASLISQLLVNGEELIENGSFDRIHVFHNKPNSGVGYTPVVQQLLPLDRQWKQGFLKQQWPTKLLPQIAGDAKLTLLALVHEYLFASLFKACAESLASENASRLISMQRAEKNISELLDDLNHQFHQLRQGLIDEELFDVISGFEALKK